MTLAPGTRIAFRTRGMSRKREGVVRGLARDGERYMVVSHHRAARGGVVPDMRVVRESEIVEVLA